MISRWVRSTRMRSITVTYFAASSLNLQPAMQRDRRRPEGRGRDVAHPLSILKLELESESEILVEAKFSAQDVASREIEENLRWAFPRRLRSHRIRESERRLRLRRKRTHVRVASGPPCVANCDCSSGNPMGGGGRAPFGRCWENMNKGTTHVHG